MAKFTKEMREKYTVLIPSMLDFHMQLFKGIFTQVGFKAEIITNPIHKKLITVHPSPLSAYNGFFGCKHFSKTNEILLSTGQTPIDWTID